mmetsp:Transcript_1532/g.2087  ORF Transcript_1532/g.2087 Transcript_1532/m.2087 type:complete len:339 (+) Transcript_1532:686-1702(+)
MVRLTRNMGTDKVASIFLLTPRCIALKGSMSLRSSTAGSPLTVVRAFLGAFFSPVAISTSSAVTRPNSPVPSIEERSILAFFARARAVGVAAITPGAGMYLGLAGSVAFLGAAPPLLAAASTSAPVMRPLGPLPVIVLRSTPRASAFFFAIGEATIRPPVFKVLAGVAAFGAAAAFGAGAAAAGAAATAAPPPAKLAAYAFRAGISPSSAAINATGFPTSDDSPSSVMMAARYPSSNASTSISALSLSTTMIASPLLTASPSLLSHDTIFPSFIVLDKAGISMRLNSQSGAALAAGAVVAAGAEGAAAGPACTAAISSSFSTTTATRAPTSAVSPSCV